MQASAGPAFLAWIETTAPARAMREALWLYPGVEIVHILGFVLLVGGVAMFDLRLLGAVRGVGVASLAQSLLPWSWVGLAVAVPSGLLMFAAHATELAANPAFQIKLVLLLVAGLNAWLFHRRLMPRAPLESTPSARLAAAVSLLTWVGVIACGRLLAYL